MPEDSDTSGMAALTICEALLLAMNDKGLLAEHEIVGLLSDAATTHENAAVASPERKDAHRAVAGVINGIIASGYAATDHTRKQKG